MYQDAENLKFSLQEKNDARLKSTTIPIRQAIKAWDNACNESKSNDELIEAILTGAQPAYVLGGCEKKRDRLDELTVRLGKIVEPELLAKLRADIDQYSSTNIIRLDQE